MTKILIFLLINVLCFIDLGYARQKMPADQSKKVQRYVSEALHAYKKGDYSRSRIEFEKLFHMLEINGSVEITKPVDESEHEKQVNDYITKLEPIILERTASIQAQYDQGVTLFNLGQFKASIDYFAKVLLIQPNYKDTISYVTSANTEILKLQEEQIAEREKQLEELAERQRLEQMDIDYRHAIQLYEKKEFVASFMHFKKVRVYDQEYKQTGQFYKKLKIMMKEQANKLYKDGLTKYSDGDIAAAVDLWDKALELVPDYKEVLKASERAKARLAQ